MITYTTKEKTMYVAVPFHIKDSFKELFKTAKWDGFSKKWTLNIKHEKNLQLFIQESKDALQTLEHKELLEDEKIATELSISRIKDSLKIYDADLELYKKFLAIVKEKREELEKFKKLETEKKEEHSKLKAEVTQELSNIIDLEEVRTLQDAMCNAFHSVKTFNREKYEDAQERLKEISKTLASVGLRSDGINELAYMNWNRKDRDNPADITFNDICNISKI